MATPQRACDAWNDQYPIGTRVKIVNQDGTDTGTETTTRSAAFVGDDTGRPMIYVDGVDDVMLLALAQPI